MKRAAIVVVVFVAAGCGAAARKSAVPALPHALAQRWAHRVEAIAAADPCAAHRQAVGLRMDVILAINKHTVPQRLLEPLTSKVNALADHNGCAPVKVEARNLAGWLRDSSS